MPALVQLNAATSQVFNGIGRSPIPVLLPFDAAAWLGARQSGTADDATASSPISARTCSIRLSGYDADILLPSGAGDGMPGRTLQNGRGADHRIAAGL